MYTYNNNLWYAILVVLAFSFLAQWLVNSTYKKYSKIKAAKGLTAEQVAEKILAYHKVQIPIKQTAGQLTDNYDPRTRTLNLSSGVYGADSIAAYGIAAHEAGHAIQHARAFLPLQLRNNFWPVANFGSNLGPWLFILGLFLQFDLLIDAGIIFFAFAVLFSLITLPVELDASRRAVLALSGGRLLTAGELTGAKKVLSAAALTYLAATLMAILEMLRFLALRNSRRN
ncbi:MAG: zinc metallopeptidase [Candidatus Margulisbacteria bacterium]|jgi:Zn-dependent membrane protease YugP|nr:zinc metallopeptidase [Candidatus Margulisiibacteriota bacterium]